MATKSTPKASAKTKTVETTTAKSAVITTKLAGWRQWVGILLLIVGGISFFMAQSATWVSTAIFNQQNFVQTTGKVLSTDQSRHDIAAVIVDQALQNQPVLQKFVGSQATALLSGLLGTDLASNVYNRVANTAYAYLTSPNQQDVAIDLTAIKDPLVGIIKFAENQGRTVKFDPQQIPDKITLVDASTVPDLNVYIQRILVFNVLFWLVAIAALVSYVFLQANGRIRRIYQVCLTLAIVAAVGLLTGPFIPPAIASFVALVGIRDVVTNIAQAFLAPFEAQMWVTLVIVGVAALLIRLRHQMQRGVAYVMNSISSKKEPAKK